MRRRLIKLKDNKNIKELVFYSIIVIVLIIISILNNAFWKIGKKEKLQEKTMENEQQLLEINNITYDVPYEERWLD